MKSIRVIHVYGKMGDLPWQSKSGRSYTPDLNRESLITASRGIKIIREGEEESEEIKEAKQILRNASQIHFLGFGYHDDNIRRLGLLEMPSLSPKSIFGTALGLEPQEIFVIEGKYKFLQLLNINWDVLNYIRNTIPM